jgi:ABC-type multidrug transport system fused ATPase/permease subunit
LVMATVLLALPAPLIMRYLIDRVILDQQMGLLAGTLLLLAIVKGLGMLAELLQRVYFARLEQELLLDVQRQLLEQTLHLPKSFFDAQQTGYLMERLSSDVDGLRWFFSGTLVYALSHLVRLAGGAAFLFYLEWRLALLALVALPGLVACVRYFSRRAYVLSHHSMEQQANVSRRLQESLSAATLIKAFTSEEREVEKVMAQLRSAFQVTLEWVTVGAAANMIISALADLARMLVLAGGAYLIITGNWSLGSLLAFQAYLGYVYGPAQFLAYSNLEMQRALASLERVSTLLALPPEEDPQAGLKVEQLQGQVELRGVVFSFNFSSPILENISFHVQAGERVAIVGPSGAGKTTLISLLLGFYHPSEGEVLFDGRPVKEYNLAALRGRIGYVPQHNLLLEGTLGENLRYGNQAATQEQVERAARAVEIHDFITGLPEGYDSVVSEQGGNLSEGQKQRISLARALIKEPDILVLDEPTSALDNSVESSIFEALPILAEGKTIFVVTHRLSTIRKAGRVLVLNEKHIAGDGIHAELLATNPYYCKLIHEGEVMASA